MSVENKVINIIVRTMEIEDRDDVVMKASFVNDLGADSLMLFALIDALEEEFEMDISDDDIETIKTVKDAVNYIKEH